jgi:hypothetical protein
MTFGVIFVAYQAADLLPRSLPVWLSARRANLGGNTFKIAAVCVPFVGFNHGESTTLDDTLPMLRSHLAAGDIDHLVESAEPLTEVEARGRALRWLMGSDGGVDAIWQCDADEFLLKEDIQGAAAYVESQPYTDWFRVAYRNLVFTSDQYLAEPFTPPRIHRARIRGYRAHGFWADNNVLYGGTITRDLVQDLHFSSATIPEYICNPLHETWLSNLRSKQKIAYQTVARGWPSCSFRWDEETDTLRFNEAHFAALGQPLPEVKRLS